MEDRGGSRVVVARPAVSLNLSNARDVGGPGSLAEDRGGYGSTSALEGLGRVASTLPARCRHRGSVSLYMAAGSVYEKPWSASLFLVEEPLRW